MVNEVESKKSKIHKFVVYVLDDDDEFSLDDITDELEQNGHLMVRPFHEETKKISWEDYENSRMNEISCTKEEFDDEFKKL